MASNKIEITANFFETEAISMLQQLVRIPSENSPPGGNERRVQEFFHNWLKDRRIESKLYYPHEIPGFSTHPARLPERNMRNRPNVVATYKGSGAGQSLLLIAHSDVMPAGNLSLWNDDPFSGKITNGRLYGRGSGDDKCGMAIMATVLLILKNAGVRLAGDLTIASVSDEEYGGGNGTAALLASGVKADAAVYLDGSNQTIWNVALGGGIAEIVINADSPDELAAIIKKIEIIILGIKDERKKAILAHPDFGRNFFNNEMEGFYNIEKIFLGGQRAKLSFLLDTLPGENEEALIRNAEQNLNINNGIKIKWMSRFLKPVLKLPCDFPLITTLSKSFAKATGNKVKIGPGRQSDQGLVSHFGNIPCVVFGCGRRGKEGAPHLPNEYILLEDFKENLLTVALMAANWCGATDALPTSNMEACV